MKKFILVALATCSLIACSKSEDKKKVMGPADPKSDSKSVQDAQKNAHKGAGDVVDESEPTYSSANLVLIYPHTGNFGWIRFEGNDGKKLFETLQVKTVSSQGNTVWNPSRTKQGIQLNCIEQAMKITPQNPDYTCSFYINYRTGGVNKTKSPGDTDSTVPKLTADYTGEMLQIKAKSSADAATFTLEGPDAQALFTTIKVEAVDIEAEGSLLAGKAKRGEDIECRSQAEKSTPEKALYKCMISFDALNGKVKRLSN